MSTRFIAWQVVRNADASFSRQLIERSSDELPPGELLVRVDYSSLNYKDALSATGHPGVTRNFPHTPGIDAAGTVLACTDNHFAIGDEVIVTGYDLGMETDGGFGQLIRVPSHWALLRPAGLTLREAMILGTAGLTAALSVKKLRSAGVQADAGEILITGATGGVGSLAIAILKRLGYRVVAATGKVQETDFLRQLGAAEVIGRGDVGAGEARPLLKERWAGAVDCVGGEILAAAIKATRYNGAVTCCGLVGSAELPLNVYPFILRGVSLHGIDSVFCPRPLREELWALLADTWKPETLEKLAEECRLAEVEGKIQLMLRGQLRGRTVIELYN